MLDVIDCECCGSALSYGDAFRHRLALDVADGRIAAKRILGDRLAPRQPRQLCGACRTHALHTQTTKPVVSENPRWMLPLLAAFAGALVVTATLMNRHA